MGKDIYIKAGSIVSGASSDEGARSELRVPRMCADEYTRRMNAKSIEASYDQSVSAVHNRLFFRLFQVGNTLERQARKELGITPVQWAVLGALSRPQAKRGMSFSELAEYLVVSRQNLDGVLKRLERDAHVQRVADAADRRARRVVLTPKGRSFWVSVQSKIYEFYRQALQGVRFDDKVTFVHLLNTLNTQMKEVDLSTRRSGRET
jgi:DNA-binding MarR family transcriptional regulator